MKIQFDHFLTFLSPIFEKFRSFLSSKDEFDHEENDTSKPVTSQPGGGSSSVPAWDPAADPWSDSTTSRGGNPIAMPPPTEKTGLNTGGFSQQYQSWE